MDPQPEKYSFNFKKETAEIVAESHDALSVKIGEFAGPLDLLLYLIRQEQADIFDTPIARTTDEYLRYIRMMKSLDIAVAADFLVMSAQLIEIKSKMLLPYWKNRRRSGKNSGKRTSAICCPSASSCTISTNVATFPAPTGAMIPSSDRCARKALIA